MQPSIAEKLAEHLATVAAHARVKRALDAYMQKRAEGNTDFLYGGGGGALLGALAGGGTTAIANLLRKKKDRKSILHNALLGGLGGGALGLAGTSIYKGMQAPDKKDMPATQKEVDKLTTELRKKDTAADAAREHAKLISPEFKALASVGAGGAGFVTGSGRDRYNMLTKAYSENQTFRDYVNKNFPNLNATERDAMFQRASTVGRYGALNQPRAAVPARTSSQPFTPKVTTPAQPAIPAVTPHDLRMQAREGGVAVGGGKNIPSTRPPVASRLSRGLAGLISPWLVEPIINYGFGMGAAENAYQGNTRLQGELAATPGTTTYQANQPKK